jgi:hypothetical protein
VDNVVLGKDFNLGMICFLFHVFTPKGLLIGVGEVNDRKAISQVGYLKVQHL